MCFIGVKYYYAKFRPYHDEGTRIVPISWNLVYEGKEINEYIITNKKEYYESS